MKTYEVTYTGNAIRFTNFSSIVLANSEMEAVEDVYQQVLNDNYFPQEDGSIENCDGHVIAEPDDNIIEHDGGYFSAEEIED